MYEKHPFFVQPVNENEKVWRYVDLPKFVSLLESSCLYFCSAKESARADKTGDPFEGSITAIDWENRRIMMLSGQEPTPSLQKYIDEAPELARLASERFYINCWHNNQYESAAMWRLYSGEGAGLAIQTTYGKFRDSIIDDKTVRIGAIRYIDYSQDAVHDARPNVFRPFLHKRKSFEHEREIRAIYYEGPRPFDESPEDRPVSAGINIKVNLDLLIENLFISPYSPPWFRDLLQMVLRRYGIDREVHQSTFGTESPLF